MDNDITDKLIGKEVTIFSKNRASQEEKDYEGKIVSITPGREVVLGTGPKANIPVSIPFAGTWEGIIVIYHKIRNESKGVNSYEPLYYNSRVFDAYKFNPWDDSILEDKAAREIISSHGKLY
ncbi:MAG TPA: hypothetical protein VJ461_02720 [Candidatus Nanoarchaeia archaeon]|nr:hypothetical protein [Candidatus Nanoarchaeia archaeon]